MSDLLVVNDLEVRYGRSSSALHGVSLAVPDGHVVAVLGSNGAGKTTTLRAISGFARAETGRVAAGSIEFEGESIVGLSPHQIARRGIAIIPERDKVFATLSVSDNLSSVPVVHGDARRRKQEEFVFHLFPVLAERRRFQAGLLSGGERQMLTVARCLLLEPKLILADELSFGLAPVLVMQMMAALRRTNVEEGISILLVEQNAQAAFEIADDAYVMETGRVVMRGKAAELRDSDEVRRVYFGLDDAVEGLPS
jgi:branched-chain amino acid transport system ATP-binding protein